MDGGIRVTETQSIMRKAWDRPSPMEADQQQNIDGKLIDSPIQHVWVGGDKRLMVFEGEKEGVIKLQQRGEYTPKSNNPTEQIDRREARAGIADSQLSLRRIKGKGTVMDKRYEGSETDEIEDFVENNEENQYRIEAQMMIQEGKELGIIFSRKGRELERDLQCVLEATKKRVPRQRKEWVYRQGI